VQYDRLVGVVEDLSLAGDYSQRRAGAYSVGFLVARGAGGGGNDQIIRIQKGLFRSATIRTEGLYRDGAWAFGVSSDIGGIDPCSCSSILSISSLCFSADFFGQSRDGDISAELG